MSAEEVLTAFRRGAPYLFLGAAFAAVGMVSAAFAVLRRQRDSLLICFASFAALYGLRLWISSPMLARWRRVRPSTRARVEPLIT
jgi:phosphoserine phosphatase RsbU/P